MPCTRCGIAHPPSVADAVHSGWIRIEFHGASGPKYGYFCPRETPDQIAVAVREWGMQSRSGMVVSHKSIKKR